MIIMVKEQIQNSKYNTTHVNSKNIYIHIHIHTHIHICVHTRTHIHTEVQMFVCVCTSICQIHFQKTRDAVGNSVTIGERN